MPYRSKRSGRDGAEVSTRERILQAAIVRFSATSYEGATLRDLAADVGVDVAYVHRCFGSKEQLFGEALRASLPRERMFGGNVEDLAATIAREVLRERNANERHPLDITLRSFSSPEASRVLCDVIMESFVETLTEMRPEVPKHQAALIAALVAGVGILREVIGAPPLQEREGGALEATLVRTIEGMMNDHANARLA